MRQREVAHLPPELRLADDSGSPLPRGVAQVEMAAFVDVVLDQYRYSLAHAFSLGTSFTIPPQSWPCDIMRAPPALVANP